MAKTPDKRLFRVNKRTLPNGKIRYYASFAKPNGTWTTRTSTGKSTRGAAEKWCLARLRDGSASSMVSGGDVTLRAWCTGFWGADGRYDRDRKARGYTLSHVYLENNRRDLEKYIFPELGHLSLYELTPVVLDTFFLGMFHDSKLSGASVNNIMKSLRGPLREAERLGVIERNPMRAVQNMAANGKERGVLTQEELETLFAVDALATVWKGDRLSMIMCMLAAGCGLRHAEALAVRPMDIHDGVLRVHRQWDRASYVFKPPKWNSIREVPVPPRLLAEIDAYTAEHGLPTDGVLAAGPILTQPRDRENTTPALRDALVRIGISEDEQGREARFLDLHALRHTYITRLRASGVADWQIQGAAGHRSIKMTDHYTHGRGADYAEVAAARILPFKEAAS